MTTTEPTCELDPITWDAMVDGMKRHHVPDDIVGKVCADALAAINATPESKRAQLNAQAGLTDQRS
ncbi:hypothetical protein F4553_000795 [Allocatelliglobosispora scoriae]|uniref:Uncharacterized protein n=1 Tax=Allocatelliglobosispora scoriae TaxID=643052 RepID=A0A841BJP0_9ACTN|nr:hypothetical protein [Allocatelliglobosispora scoriae]MBB5867416.1 hypothetical protein [Allocatelliglobosispora scoriae]